MQEIVFLNGKFILKEEAKTSVFDVGFLYGWGLFETMRSYNMNIVYLEQHLKRLKDSSRIINIKLPLPLDKIKSVILKTIELNRIKDAYVRLALWKREKGNNISVMVKPYKDPAAKKYGQGFRVTVSSLRQNEASQLTRLKSMNYLLYQLAYREAKKKDFDEVIILNNRGNITEGSRSNLFFAKDNEVFTPSLECGCLPGITREVIIDIAKKYNLKIYQGSFTLEELYEADEAFLTNSLMGVMPLISIEKKLIAKGSSGKITKFFIKKYDHLLYGTKKDKTAF